MKAIITVLSVMIFSIAARAQWNGASSATDYTSAISRQGKVTLNSSGWDQHLEITRSGDGGTFQPDIGAGYKGLRLQLKTNSNFYVMGGNVGINNTNPTSMLDVNLAGSNVVFRGNSSSDITADLFIQRVSSTGGLGRASCIQFQDVGNGDQIMVQGGSGGFQVFNYTTAQGTWVERMRINQAGNMAIGTNVTNGYKLAVEGTIGAREVNVNTSTWSDYVFYEDYKLPSLESVKKYIDANHHLPEIPSAQEVEEKGINVGEMNALLLKKIEELTLYVIDQQQQIKKLTESSGEQLKQINDLKATIRK